jgi:hypothetical protein
MPSNPNTRRTVKGGAFAIIFIAGLGFAAPAQADTVVFSCEEVVVGASSRVPQNWTVDIDFSASTVKFADLLLAPAVITDREITFSYQVDDPNRVDANRVRGRIDRLAGTITVYISYVYPPRDETYAIEARCRRATTRI